MSTLTREKIKNILEASLFASDKPLTLDRMAQLFNPEECPSREEMRGALDALAQDYLSRGVELKEVSSGYRFQVRPQYATWVGRLWDEKPGRYSRAVLETLALIAYRQPITRGEIEDIRGVAVSSNIIKSLQEREWIRVVGHREVPGRPALFATTRQFLDYFNLKSLDELPPLTEIRDLDLVELLPDEDFTMPAQAASEQSETIWPLHVAQNPEPTKNPALSTGLGLSANLAPSRSPEPTLSPELNTNLEPKPSPELNTSPEQKLSPERSTSPGLHTNPELSRSPEARSSQASNLRPGLSTSLGLNANLEASKSPELSTSHASSTNPEAEASEA